MHLNAKRFKNKVVFAAALALPCTAQAISLRELDTGIPEAYLAQLSTSAARDMLFSKLEQENSNARMRDIIKRLAKINKIGERDPLIAKRLIGLIDKSSRKKKLSERDRVVIDEGLRVIGVLGAQAELEYLVSWTKPAERLKRVRFPDDLDAEPNVMKRQFFIDAVTGLGLSGTDYAHEQLLALKSNPPTMGRSIVPSLDIALSTNREIHDKGLERYFADSLERMK